MEPPWLRTLLLLLLLVPLTACGGKLRPFAPKEAQQPIQSLEKDLNGRGAQNQVQRQWMEQERCLRDRPGLEAQMVALRQAELELARAKQESYRSLPPPEPWDESKESRYRLEDREADWQRYLQRQEDWQRREQSHRASWMASHQARLQRAQATLNRHAQVLRTRRPDLFTGPNSIEFNPEVAQRLRHC
jgi:hypothetical protein